MQRALLIALALALGALAVALLPRHASRERLPEPPAPASALDSPAATGDVPLSSTEAAAPAEARREEPAGPTQAYGWLTTADGLPADGGLLRLFYEDHSSMSCSAAEAHARQQSHPWSDSLAFRDARVQEDGGWVLDLPGKCWLVRAEYLPPPDLEPIEQDIQAAQVDLAAEQLKAPQAQLNTGPFRTQPGSKVPEESSSAAPDIEQARRKARIARFQQAAQQRLARQAQSNTGPARTELGATVLDVGPARSASAKMVRTRIAIEAPLERGAREISFRVDRPLELRGIVVDGLGAPVANATILPRMADDAALSATSGKDGEFVIAGIPPEDLIVEEGMLEVRVGAPGFKPSKRLLPVGAETARLPAQRFVLWRR